MARKKPQTFDQLYPGRFLKAGSFNGKKVTLTIKDADLEELEGEDGKKSKAIISFVETPLQLVACKTNGLCVKEMFGQVLADWVGKKVILFPSKWNNEDCIRVWGSPDIKREFDITVRLPRRKPFQMTMHKSAGKQQMPPEADFSDPTDDQREVEADQESQEGRRRPARGSQAGTGGSCADRERGGAPQGP